MRAPPATLESRVNYRFRDPELLRRQLVSLHDDPTGRRPVLLGRFLKLDERIAAYLLGCDAGDPQLLSLAPQPDIAQGPYRLARFEHASAIIGQSDLANFRRLFQVRGRCLAVVVPGVAGIGIAGWLRETEAGRAGWRLGIGR